MIDKYLENHWFMVEKIRGILYFESGVWKHLNSEKSLFEKIEGLSKLLMPCLGLGRLSFLQTLSKSIGLEQGIFIFGRLV